MTRGVRAALAPAPPALHHESEPYPERDREHAQAHQVLLQHLHAAIVRRRP